MVKGCQKLQSAMFCCLTVGRCPWKRVTSFEKVMCKDNDLVQFWKTQKQNPEMSSDMWRSLGFTKPSQLPVPYVLHGDGAPYTEIDSLQVLSLRMLAFDKHHL